MRNPLTRAAGLFVLVALSGCSTLAYRGVQEDFEAAIQAESNGLAAALSGEDRYKRVAATLSDRYINALDPRLHANAYMIRAVCEWRSRDSSAIATAETGLGRVSDGDAGRRDQIVLKMIRPLVIETEVMDRWLAAGRVSTAAQMNECAKDLTTAMQKLDEAGAAMQDKTTPSSTRDYYHFQRWRIYRNWGQLIATIETGDDDKTLDAKIEQRKLVAGLEWFATAASAGDGDKDDPIRTLATWEADKIRADSPLRQRAR